MSSLADAALMARYNEWMNERMYEAAGLSQADLDHVLDYTNTRGVRSQKRMASLVLHFFNHQTHHRGQASTLLFQAGQDIGATDVLVHIPNET